MQNIPFLIWMLLFPALTDARDLLQMLIRHKVGLEQKENKYTNGVIALASLIELIFWFYVGHLLYKS